MTKAAMKQLLIDYLPTDSEEITAKARMLEFLDTYDTCFHRELQIGHFTASAWLLNSDCSAALLMHHAKLDMWMQLGGHCDGDSDVLRVALKEASEESGIENIVPVSPKIFDIEIHPIPARPNEPEHYHYDIRFLLKTVNNDNFKMNAESKGLQWVGKDASKLPTTEANILRMFNKWVTL